MQLLPECFDALRYRAFWEQSEKNSLKKFLDFRLQEVSADYLVGCMLTGERLSIGRDEKNSKEVNIFWDLQAKQQNKPDMFWMRRYRPGISVFLYKKRSPVSVPIRHGRNIPNYCETDEPEYEPKRIRRESNTRYSEVTEPQQSATPYLTPPMTEVAESSSSNSYLGNLDGSKNKNSRSQYVRDEPSFVKARHVQVQLATIEEQVYEKIISMLQPGNKSVINDSIVKKLENIFQASYFEIESRSAFPDVKYMWLEKDVRSIKEANIMFTNNFGERKTDLLILRLSDAREFLNVEVSGPPYNLRKNTRIQVIGGRLTLFAVSLTDKRKYLAVELASYIFVEQGKLQKKIRSFIPDNNCSENLREWLHIPDDDISLFTEEDMDEILL
ncbi:16537_t:CDS:2 [Funneliformis geosporum]|uniref:16537_t:CDS:1 n=1 Tax=Funneliformis geosporum TaxID=1117311 RepID=A0A9W4WL58_9GLOM|nr:16537_t:CDS:2 [Funneliformis geosporum]